MLRPYDGGANRDTARVDDEARHSPGCTRPGPANPSAVAGRPPVGAPASGTLEQRGGGKTTGAGRITRRRTPVGYLTPATEQGFLIVTC